MGLYLRQKSGRLRAGGGAKRYVEILKNRNGDTLCSSESAERGP
jgi:hypothetical protein